MPKYFVLPVSPHPRVDVLELYKQFDQFPEAALFGVASDIGKRYRQAAEGYLRLNPGSLVGTPGYFQVIEHFQRSLPLNKL